jgi:trigger factor
VIGSNRLMPGVEEEMVGLKRGPEQVISFLMPAETNQLLHQLVKDNYFGKETTTVANILDNLKVGQQIEVHLNIKNIESLQLAPANDEFAQKLGFDDLTSLRQQISKDLVKRTEDDFLDQLMNKIVIGSEFEIPEALIQKEIDHELSNLVLELTKQGKTLADYQKELNFNSSEEFNQQLRHQSTYNLKVQLVSLEIINQENLIVTDQEVEDFYNKIAVQEKVDLDFIRQQVNQEQLKNQLMTEKLISFLIENNG